MAHHVFISYASKNKQLADALCHTLEQHRISCWIAPRDVLPGEPYAREIIRGIRDCQIIVLIYTNDSNASEHVLNEIDKAFNYGKVIIPFIADDTRMSDDSTTSPPPWPTGSRSGRPTKTPVRSRPKASP